MTTITEEFFDDLKLILRPGAFQDLANAFAHYADSDVIRREYHDLGDDAYNAWLDRELRTQHRQLSAGWSV